MKIHISSSTQLALEQLGGYVCEHRGSMEIKVTVPIVSADLMANTSRQVPITKKIFLTTELVAVMERKMNVT